jgi:hypothetical protein
MIQAVLKARDLIVDGLQLLSQGVAEAVSIGHGSLHQGRWRFAENIKICSQYVSLDSSGNGRLSPQQKSVMLAMIVFSHNQIVTRE